MVFLLTVMRTSPRAASASLPVTPSGRTSTSMRWLSVPPETMEAPASANADARAWALRTVWAWSRRVLGDVAHLTAAVVPAPRVAFGVLRGQESAHCLQHRRARIVLARDQLEVRAGALLLVAHDLPDVGI